MLTAPFFVGTVWAVINAIQKEFELMAHKLIWIIVAGVPFVGFIIYFLFGARKGRSLEKGAIEQ